MNSMGELLATPEVRELINGKVGTDWSYVYALPTENRVPITFLEGELAPNLPMITVYVSKDHSCLEKMWERRKEIIQKAEGIDFFELEFPKHPMNQVNMEWKYISFLTLFDVTLDFAKVKEFIRIKKEWETAEGLHGEPEFPSGTIRVSVKNWECSDREILLGGTFNGYTLEYLEKNVSSLKERVDKLKAIISEGDEKITSCK